MPCTMPSPADAMRYLSAWLVPMACLALAGCAFEDGDPWGEVTVDLTAAAPASFRTADGVQVALDRVEITVDAVALYGGDAVAAEFDPSAPPEGCTLCHGGHCHCGDELVDYDVLAARLAGGEDAPPVRVLGGAGEPVPLAADPRPVPLADCPDGCAVPRGTLRRVEVTVSGLRIAGRAGDAPFDLDLALAAPITAGLTARFDRGEPLTAAIDLALRLPAELLDGLDPTAPGADAAAIVGDNLATFAALAVDVRRP